MVLSEDRCGNRFEASMASAEHRDHELMRLVNEQATVRRTAMMVVHGLPPQRVFEEVAGAVGALHGADYSVISRYEPDRTMAVVALWAAPGTADVKVPAGLRWKVDGTSAEEAFRTGRPVRRPSDRLGGKVGIWARSLGIGHIVACPIKIEEEVWGELAALYLGPEPPPEETEQHIYDFVQLIGCTITQAESRAELIASRARLLNVFDTARRSLERDLHDGVQQRLISLGLQLREAQACLTPDQRQLEGHLRLIDEDLAEIMRQVHEISHGLRPAALSRGGLATALPSLARRFKIPIDFDLDLPESLDDSSEIAIYYVVSESLTNVVKHSHADKATVRVGHGHGVVSVEIRDNGSGGADPRKGSGIIGLRDRIEARGGTFQVISTRGEGTVVRATVPT